MTNSPLDAFGPDKSDLYGLLVRSCTNYIIGFVLLLLATDGSFDIGISHVMCWSIWIWAAVLILQDHLSGIVSSSTFTFREEMRNVKEAMEENNAKRKEDQNEGR
ncbi:hypothetical protein HID58_017494 [Brassica napus]|uniref:Uncharacterized protein n=1 Tax=Brassica napus TaxID=3708 RepID=A0ABQ8D8Z2_BRANA|nr:hypothetical protein HID58_017494 [Brassica napus]